MIKSNSKFKESFSITESNNYNCNYKSINMEYVTLLIEELKKLSINTLNNNNSNYKKEKLDPVYLNHQSIQRKPLIITKLININTSI